MTQEVEDFGPIQLQQPSTKTAQLTEREILDCLRTYLRIAAECAMKLGNGERGKVYAEFMRAMRLVEGASRQVGHWREDARWFPFGLKIADAQQRCGRWLREKEPAWKFKALAELLAFALCNAVELETKRTGRVGSIMPRVLTPETRTQERPVSVILPAGFKREIGTMH